MSKVWVWEHCYRRIRLYAFIHDLTLSEAMDYWVDGALDEEFTCN